MKKLILFLCIGGTLGFSSCGPSAEQVAKDKKAMEDSILAAQQFVKDSIAAAVQKATEDSIMAAQAAQKDSIAAAETAAKASKPKAKAKTPEQKKQEEVKKATRGRG